MKIVSSVSQGGYSGALLSTPLDEVGVQTPPDFNPLRQTKRSLRILMVATEAPPVQGGIARIIGYLRDGFQAHGHHVDIFAYPEVRRIAFGEVRLSGFIFKLPRLLRHINEYDIIHIHGATPTISDVALFFTRLCGSYPCVIYTHHMDLDFAPVSFLNRAYNHLHHRLSTQADAVIASTWDTLRLLTGGSRGLVIPFGVDLERFSANGPKDAPFTVLFVGQFRPYKGVQTLLQAMTQVTSARLLLVGQGPEEQTYRSLAVELDLDVEFHIGVDDNQLSRLYQRAHTVVLPSVSRLETFGLVLLEGMAAGCVPIASDLPGVHEVVGQTGILFPVGDANHLARILRGLRDNPALVKQMSEHAVARVAGFSQERTIWEYERLIMELIAWRDLKDRLANRTQSSASSLQAFTAEVAQNLEADWTQIVLCSTQDVFYPVASTKSNRLLGHCQLQQASSLLAQYAINTGDSALVGLNNGPLHLRNVVAHEVPAAMVTPLTRGRKRFGALLSMRECPFDQRDLDSFVRLARYVAPLLHEVAKRAAGGVNI